jgi:hypothetical protein
MKKVRVCAQMTFRRGIITLISEEESHTPSGMLIEKGVSLCSVKRQTFNRMERPLSVQQTYDKHGNVAFVPVLKWITKKFKS